jgi:hypothetical protein
MNDDLTRSRGGEIRAMTVRKYSIAKTRKKYF